MKTDIHLHQGLSEVKAVAGEEKHWLVLTAPNGTEVTIWGLRWETEKLIEQAFKEHEHAG